MYSLNVSDFQRPRVRIWASENLLSAASEAALIRKLCPLYLRVSRPQNCKHRESSVLNW